MVYIKENHATPNNDSKDSPKNAPTPQQQTISGRTSKPIANDGNSSSPFPNPDVTRLPDFPPHLRPPNSANSSPRRGNASNPLATPPPQHYTHLQQQQQRQQLQMQLLQRQQPQQLSSLPHPNSAKPPAQNWYDSLIEKIVGDMEGPENKYALICDQCFTHNGLALKDEFLRISAFLFSARSLL